jgi:hypothetical protein
LPLLQSIQSRCSKRSRYRKRVELSWNWLLVQSVTSDEVLPSFVRRGPLCRWPVAPAVRVSRVGRTGPQLSHPAIPLFEFCLSFRALPSETWSAGRNPQTTLMDFRSLQHMQGSAIHCSRVFHARYGPPSGFGHPHGGFRPSNPGRLYFTPAALVGFALRSVPLRPGDRCVSARSHPPAVYPVGKRPARMAGGRPDGPRLLGFVPCRSSLRPVGD